MVKTRRSSAMENKKSITDTKRANEEKICLKRDNVKTKSAKNPKIKTSSLPTTATITKSHNLRTRVAGNV